MNLKSTLWALAFACAAVSCSDDVDDGLNNNEENELTGPTTYMKVTINSNVTTKADPTGGEEGDVDEGELGDESEYKVNDVTVVLYTDKDGNVPTQFTSDCKLVASGYKDGIAQMETSSELWHSRTTATVTITVTDPAQQNSFDGKTYGIIAVTNLGSQTTLSDRIKEGDIDTGAELANFLQVNAWDNSKGFVMSTHNDTYNNPSTAIFDKVTLKAGVDATNAPTTSVHVERLAAKIRINKAASVTDFIYTVNSGAETEAKVRLDQVAIVNKLTSGSYLLKRVTQDVTNCYTELSTTSVANDIFLGNENTDGDGFGINYVIDPWTRAKETITPSESNLNDRDALTGASLTSSTTGGADFGKLRYDNDFVGSDYAAMWNALGDKVSLSTYSGTFPLHLAYTQENTTSLKMQKNGYSTGAIFKATYFPKKWAVTKTTVSGTTVGTVEAVDIDYNGDGVDGTGYDAISSTTAPADFKFYVYEGNVYKDYEAIFNEFVWTQQEGGVATIYSYSDFTAANIEGKAIKVADFFNHLLAGFSDPFDYIDYLIAKYDTNKDGKYDSSDTDYAADKTFVADDAIDTYLTTNQTAVDAVVLPYENGVCYYPYWIRHASNGNPTKMSVMEFAIVRNNIYDLTVTGISGLGLSGAEKPNPGKDDEEDKYYLNVEIYVKNWVVRKNSDIIL